MNIIRSKYYGIIRGVTVGIAFLLQIVTMVFLSLFLMKGFFVVYRAHLSAFCINRHGDDAVFVRSPQAGYITEYETKESRNHADE